MPLKCILEGKAPRCAAKAKHSGTRCWRLAAHGGRVCTSHGYRPRETVRLGAAHWNYQAKGETRLDRAERSARLTELRDLEASMVLLGVLEGARWRGRKPKART